jgi:hypothetical protein
MVGLLAAAAGWAGHTSSHRSAAPGRPPTTPAPDASKPRKVANHTVAGERAGRTSFRQLVAPVPSTMPGLTARRTATQEAPDLVAGRATDLASFDRRSCPVPGAANGASARALWPRALPPTEGGPAVPPPVGHHLRMWEAFVSGCFPTLD